MGPGVGGRLSTPGGMPTEHAAQVLLLDMDLEKSLLLLLGPCVRHKRCGLALLYAKLVRYSSGHIAGSSCHNPGLAEPDDSQDATGSCLAWWNKGREARVCLTM